MKIFVCIKQVISRESPLRVNEEANWIRSRNAEYELNESDSYALEAGLRLKEMYGGKVVVCSAGPERVSQLLREGLARGADSAIHVLSDDLETGDGFAIAEALACGLCDERPDLVLTGLQSDDRGFASTGVALAELLRIPHSTIIVDIEISDNVVRVKRELEGGWFQWISMPLPALLTIQSGINQLRYATLKGIMAAKKKQIRTVAGQAVTMRHRVLSLYAPEKTKQTTMIEGTPEEVSRELVRLLREEAGAI